MQLNFAANAAIARHRMTVRFLLIFTLILSGCASTFFDRDQRNPIYHNGGTTVLTPVLPTTGTVIGKEFHPSNERVSQKRSLSPEELAIGGVLASGVTLAMNKDYYKSSFISGRCRCVARNEPDFEIPCGTVTVILEDREGNEISRITSEDGEFVFPVEKDRQYHVMADSPFYVGRYKETSPLQMGDSVVLQLSEKISRTGE